MKKSIKTLLLASIFIAIGCKQNEQTSSEPAAESTESWPIMRCCTLLRKRRDDERKSGREWERMGGKHEERLHNWSGTNNRRMQETHMKGEHMQSSQQQRPLGHNSAPCRRACESNRACAIAHWCWRRHQCSGYEWKNTPPPHHISQSHSRRKDSYKTRRKIIYTSQPVIVNRLQRRYPAQNPL